ncbi:MAG: hypothetical protein ACJ75R_12205 [Solirubrobacterales bacterium]
MTSNDDTFQDDVSTSLAFAVGSDPPAAGAELGQVVIATSAAVILTVILVAVGAAYRSGKGGVLVWVDGISRSLAGLPGWAGMPAFLALVCLVPALFGLSWDESLHIDNGRDPGPLANPSHYLLLLGLFGIFAAGWIAVVATPPGRRPTASAIRITDTWYAPVGGLLTLGAAGFALIGFPLDDISHRLFGQDVTLWGATHLMMMSGAVICVVGVVVLLAEGRAAFRAEGRPRPRAPLPEWTGPVQRALRIVGSHRFRLMLAGGGVLGALTIFQGEFDYGVPQFRLLYHPVLIAFAAGVALTLARLLAGRGGALVAVGFYLVLRIPITFLVAVPLGESVAHFPLYVAEAAVVEACGLVFAAEARPYPFGVACGIGIGTVGVLAEYAWSHVWMPLPWPAGMLPAAVGFGVVVAVAGGLLGAFAASALTGRSELVRQRRGWGMAAAALAVVAAVVVYLGHTTAPDARMIVSLADVPGSGPREAVATVRFDPPSVADDPDWLYTVAWQGGERVRVDPLERIGPDLYRSGELPLYGSWKSTIRLQRGDRMGAIPVYAPADAAIPAAEIPAPAHFTRPLGEDRVLLQRERKQGIPDWSILAFRLGVAACVIALLIFAGWALVRIAGGPRRPTPSPSARTVSRGPWPKTPEIGSSKQPAS